MGNKEIKKELKKLRKCLDSQRTWERRYVTPPMLQASPDTHENSEAVTNDQYRQEAYAQVESWVSEGLLIKLDEIQKEYRKSLDKDKKTLKRYEHQISKYSGEIHSLKQEIKRMNDKITSLEDKNKKMKTILKRVGFYLGVSAPDASIKEVSKSFKHENRGGGYSHSQKKKKRK